MEGRVFRAEILLGVDALAEVVGIGRGGDVVRGALHVGSEVYQRADQTAEGFVEVHQELVLPLVEGAEIVLVILEERRVVVGGLQGVPMQVAPVAVVGDADVAREAFQRVGLHGGDGEDQRAVRRGDGAAVAVGLLGVMVVLLHEDAVVRQQFDVVFHGSEIGGRKQDGVHRA